METPVRITRHYTFESGSADLLPAFCDYNLANNGLDFVAEVRRLPKEVKVSGKNRNAFYLQSVNRPDDIFMYLKGVLSATDGLAPEQEYKLAFQINFASNSRNCVGVGGSESSVWLKAGGSTLEPVPVLQANNYLTINVDKGHQQEAEKTWEQSAASGTGRIATRPRGIFFCEETMSMLSPYAQAPGQHRCGSPWAPNPDTKA